MVRKNSNEFNKKPSIYWNTKDDTKFQITGYTAKEYTREFDIDSDYVESHLDIVKPNFVIRNLDQQEKDNFDKNALNKNGVYRSESAYTRHLLCRFAAKKPGWTAYYWGDAGKATGRAFDGIIITSPNDGAIAIEAKKYSKEYTNVDALQYEVTKAALQCYAYTYFTNRDILMNNETIIRRGDNTTLSIPISVIVIAIATPTREHTFMLPVGKLDKVDELVDMFEQIEFDDANRVITASKMFENNAQKFIHSVFAAIEKYCINKYGINTAIEKQLNTAIKQIRKAQLY